MFARLCACACVCARVRSNLGPALHIRYRLLFHISLLLSATIACAWRRGNRRTTITWNSWRATPTVLHKQMFCTRKFLHPRLAISTYTQKPFEGLRVGKPSCAWFPSSRWSSRGSTQTSTPKISPMNEEFALAIRLIFQPRARMLHQANGFYVERALVRFLFHGSEAVVHLFHLRMKRHCPPSQGAGGGTLLDRGARHLSCQATAPAT